MTIIIPTDDPRGFILWDKRPTQRFSPSFKRGDRLGNIYFFLLEDVGMPGLRYRRKIEVLGESSSVTFYNSYTNDKSFTLESMVFRLPKRRGFLAGWTLVGSPVSGISRYEIHKTENDAALSASYDLYRICPIFIDIDRRAEILREAGRKVTLTIDLFRMNKQLMTATLEAAQSFDP